MSWVPGCPIIDSDCGNSPGIPGTFGDIELSPGEGTQLNCALLCCHQGQGHGQGQGEHRGAEDGAGQIWQHHGHGNELPAGLLSRQTLLLARHSPVAQGCPP